MSKNLKIILWYIFSIVCLSVVLIVIMGCNFLEVKVDVHQRSVMDKGDATQDTFTKSGDNLSDKEQNQMIIKTIP